MCMQSVRLPGSLPPPLSFWEPGNEANNILFLSRSCCILVVIQHRIAFICRPADWATLWWSQWELLETVSWISCSSNPLPLLLCSSWLTRNLFLPPGTPYNYILCSRKFSLDKDVAKKFCGMKISPNRASFILYYKWEYHILLARNFRGRKLSRIGMKWPFRRENFRRMLKPIIGGYAMPKFRGENFHEWLLNGKIHECFLTRKLCTIE